MIICYDDFGWFGVNRRFNLDTCVKISYHLGFFYCDIGFGQELFCIVVRFVGYISVSFCL